MRDEHRDSKNMIESDHVKEVFQLLKKDAKYSVIKNLCPDGGHSFSLADTMSLYKIIQLCKNDIAFDVGTGVGRLAASVAFCTGNTVVANDLPECLKIYAQLMQQKQSDPSPQSAPNTPSTSNLSKTSSPSSQSDRSPPLKRSATNERDGEALKFVVPFWGLAAAAAAAAAADDVIEDEKVVGDSSVDARSVSLFGLVIEDEKDGGDSEAIVDAHINSNDALKRRRDFTC